MPDATCVKAGGLDDKELRDSVMQVEFYTKDRMHFARQVEGAGQKERLG